MRSLCLKNIKSICIRSCIEKVLDTLVDAVALLNNLGCNYFNLKPEIVFLTFLFSCLSILHLQVHQCPLRFIPLGGYSEFYPALTAIEDALEQKNFSSKVVTFGDVRILNVHMLLTSTFELSENFEKILNTYLLKFLFLL